MGRAATDTKEKLINTAIDLIWRNSYGSVSVDEICQTADVRKGSFYHYFSSKMDLTLSALDCFYAGSLPYFEDVFNPAFSPMERISRLCDLIYSKQKETQKKYGRVCGCPFMALGSEMASQEDVLQQKINQVMALHERYYEDVIKDMIGLGQLPADTDVSGRAKQIYAYIMGHVMMARIQNNLESLQNNLEAGIFNILSVRTKEIETI